jgi:hypothetical protein
MGCCFAPDMDAPACDQPPIAEAEVTTDGVTGTVRACKRHMFHLASLRDDLTVRAIKRKDHGAD